MIDIVKNPYNLQSGDQDERLCYIAWGEGYETGQEAGRKEVVEWIEKNVSIPYPVGSIGYITWQSKLKKWGVV